LPWRICLFAAALLISLGGPLHPGGTMAEMLGHPDWLRSHALMLAAFVALLGGIIAHRRASPLPPASAKWSRIAMWGALVQVVEMAVHTVAYVDLQNLVAGKPTPVLSTHLWLSVCFYPIFAVTMIGWILATARERTLASRWIAPLGIVGAAGHGLAAPLVVGLELPGARILFALLMFFALWCALAALWPLKPRSASGPLVTS
jgi:hypothetical protein